ncbi:MAG TPA: FtsQ-type POTRA domain-containing protein [Thermoanaerobaculia bacterium]|nr:FtsQ-type POTRA domain-containing protein [Thermoanaerobaculia bacterium]
MSDVLPLRALLPSREPGSPRELQGYEGGPTPLRRPFQVKRRRKSGMAGLLAGAALRALLVVALPVGVVVWLLYSPYFLIREVKVDGGARVSAAWMQENLQPLVGRHVLAVSLDGVRRRLSTHPWVASVELRRELPDRLRVSVVERQPVALLAEKTGLSFLDGEGLAIAPVPPPTVAAARTAAANAATHSSPARPDGLIVVRYRYPGPVPVQAALDLVAELRRAHPAWGVGVREVEILGEREYRVTTAALPYPLLLEAGTVSPAVANLQQMLPDIERRLPAIGEADLRSPGRLVIRPTVSTEKPSTSSTS